jgi:hypothetical protein
MKMHPNVHSLIGQRFSRLTVLSYAGHAKWRCVCDCGAEKVTAGSSLRQGLTRSCGCLLSDIVRGRTLPFQSERKSYRGMKQRCIPGTKSYEKNFANYGAKGVSICDRWLIGDGLRTGIDCFLADMGPKPTKHHSLDRINGDAGYSPENCRWASTQEQVINRAVVRRDNGKTLAELAESTGIAVTTLSIRYRKGDRGSQLIRPSRNRRSLFKEVQP